MEMCGSSTFKNLTGILFGPEDLLFLSDWTTKETSSGTVGEMKKLLSLEEARYLRGELGFLGILLVILLATFIN